MHFIQQVDSFEVFRFTFVVGGHLDPPPVGQRVVQVENTEQIPVERPELDQRRILGGYEELRREVEDVEDRHLLKG
jgi:hypothetical protein